MAKNGTRVYAIFENGEPIALIRAGTKAQAVAHVVGDRFEAIVADQDHCISLARKGLEVQEAKRDEA